MNEKGPQLMLNVTNNSIYNLTYVMNGITCSRVMLYFLDDIYQHNEKKDFLSFISSLLEDKTNLSAFYCTFSIYVDQSEHGQKMVKIIMEAEEKGNTGSYMSVNYVLNEQVKEVFKEIADLITRSI
jgi:hypothetical protein